MKPQRDEFDGPEKPGLGEMLGKVKGAYRGPKLGNLPRMQAPKLPRLPALPALPKLPPLSPALVGAAAGVLLVVLALVVWISYPRNHLANGEIPTIEAAQGPYKVAPQDPGGMAIPYRDSTVFDALRGADAKADADGEKVENLLAPTEQPLDKAKLFPQQATTPSTSGTPDDTAAKKAAQLAPSATPSTPKADTHDDADQKPATKTPAATSGDSYVQLGAEKSMSDAQTLWKHADGAYHDQLQGLPVHYNEANLPKGTFWRVQAGPVSADKAKSVCAAINAQKAGACLVARR